MSLSNVSTPTHTPYIRANNPSPPSSSEEETLNLPGAPGPHADDHLTNGEVDEGLGKAFGVDHPLFQDLAPEDSYDKNGVYWVRLLTSQCERSSRSGGPTMEDATEMGQCTIKSRDQAGTQDDRFNVQEGSPITLVCVLQAIRYWRFRSFHRRLHVSPQPRSPSGQ